MAIVHIAMFDSVNGIAGGFRSYTNVRPARTGASMTTAIAQAARDTLTALFPSQQSTFDQFLASDLNQVRDGRAKTDGIDMGHRAAVAILSLRSNDGSQITRTAARSSVLSQRSTRQMAPGSNQPESDRPRRILGNGEAFLVMRSSRQFRTPTPPSLTSAEYTAAYNQVKLIGGDGIVTPTVRTEEQTEIGIYWAYDGTPSLCAPPSLYNQIAMHIADQMGKLPMTSKSRGCWRWSTRPWLMPASPSGNRNTFTNIGGRSPASANPIRAPAQPALAMEIPRRLAIQTFSPLGAPASNLTGPNFTPPFRHIRPAMPGSAARSSKPCDFLPHRQHCFTFISDEFNGTTRDNAGNVRPLLPRSFSSLSQAEEENGQSRIYLGIHWSSTKRKASRRAGEWQTTSLPTHSGRRYRITAGDSANDFRQ